MKVLILGGTGAMGRHLVRLLANDGVDTLVTSRKRHNSIDKVKYVQGNAHDMAFLQPILDENWDAIVDFMVYTTSSFKERINLLLSATSQYIFISSARVYADSKKPITEKSLRLLDVSSDKEFLATDEYSLSKARQEDVLANCGPKNWTIIRPYITYSEDRFQLGVLEKEEWLYRVLKGRTIVFSKEISSRTTTITYGSDVAQGIRAIINRPEALGETYHITTNDSYTWGDILTVYIEVIEKKLKQKSKVLLQNTEEFLKIKPVKYQVFYDRLYNRQFDSSKIGKYIDIDKFSQINVGIAKCLDDFLKNPRFKNINWKSEAIKDRQTKEHTPLKEIRGRKEKAKYLIFRYLLPKVWL